MGKTSLSRDLIRVLLLEGVHPGAVDVFHDAGYASVEFVKTAVAGEELLERIRGVHFVGIRSRTQLTEEVLAAADKLIGIGCFCIGTDQVDLMGAARRGIPVFNAPFSNTRSVAELVLAEIIFLMRGIPARVAAAHRGEWRKSANASHEVRGKTLGVVGYGHIGSQLSVLAESLGMRVLYFDIGDKLGLGNAESAGSLDALLASSDVVTLHVPDTPETRYMMDAQTIAKMRDGASLINASRGSVVDLDALRSELDSGRLSGAAIDVYPTEPRSNDEAFQSPLIGCDSVILTPHVGGSTHEAQANIGVEVAHKLVRYSDNGSTATAVNFPQVTLPSHEGRHRLLHIHRNEPGVLAAMNAVFADNGINVSAQYLQTSDALGYVVIDLDEAWSSFALEQLRALDATIRCRVLH